MSIGQSRHASRHADNALKTETYWVFPVGGGPALGEVQATWLGEAAEKARAKWGPNVLPWVVYTRGRSAGDPRHGNRGMTETERWENEIRRLRRAGYHKKSHPKHWQYRNATASLAYVRKRGY